MHTGEDVGVGVDGIGVLHQPGGGIVVRHHRRTQILPVGHQNAEHHRRCERHHDEPHIPAEALGVLQDQIDAQHHQQRAPGHIGEDEPLAEGDIGVQHRLCGPVVIGNKVLDGKKHRQIDRQIRAPPGVGMGLEELLDRLHTIPPTDLMISYPVLYQNRPGKGNPRPANITEFLQLRQTAAGVERTGQTGAAYSILSPIQTQEELPCRSSSGRSFPNSARCA